MKFLNTFREFIGESKAELGKVSWPTQADVKDSTGVVLITVLIILGLFVVFDFVFSELMEILLAP